MSDSADPPPFPEVTGSRVHWIRRLLWVAVPLDLLGVLCCTSVPGAVLTLAAWSVADGELARVDSGDLPLDEAPQLSRYKRISLAALVFCVLSFVLQIILLSNGTYRGWLMELDLWLARP